VRQFDWYFSERRWIYDGA